MRILAFLLVLLVPGVVCADDSTPGFAGGESGDRLLFVGDSLTLGIGASNPHRNMPGDVSAAFGEGGRRFKVLAVQGATALLMRDAYFREALQPGDVTVIWLGRSGVTNPTTLPAIRDIAAHAPGGRYLVLSILPRVYYAYEKPGSRTYAAVMKLNADLAGAFGDRILPVGADIGPADHSDELHLNDIGYAKVAKIVFDAVQARGW
jgi:lysophospholipase L1-like esterase